MSPLGVLAATRHVLATERAQAAIVRRSQADSAQPAWRQVLGAWMFGALLLILPAAVVVAAAQDAAAQKAQWARLWPFVAFGAVVLGSGHRFQWRALDFSSRDVLLQPHKAGVVFARLLRALPLLGFTGLAWACACWLHLRSSAPAPLAFGLCLAIAALAPLAWNAGRLLQRTISPRSGTTLQIAGVVLVACYFSDPGHWVQHPIGVWFELGVAAILGTLCSLSLGAAWWRDPRRELRALWPELVRLPRTFVLLVLLAPAPWFAGERLLWLAVGCGALLLVTLPLALAHLAAAAPSLEARTSQHEEAAAEAPDAPTTLRRPPRHAGRSPWRAAWRLHWLERGVARRDLRRPTQLLAAAVAWTGFLVLHVGSLWLTLGAFVNAWGQGATFAVGAGLLAPAFLAQEPSRRRWLWGVDYREQARLHMLAVAVFAAAPALVLAGVLTLALGATPERLVLCAGLAATFLVRMGWRGLPRAGELASFGGPLAALTLCAIGLAHVILTPWTAGIAAAVGTIGIWRRVQRWREPDLVAARAAARDVVPLHADRE